MIMMLLTIQPTTDGGYMPPSTDINIIQWIVGQLGRAYAFLKYMIPDYFFGGVSFWHILLSIFIIGTIISLITGDDSDIVDDDFDD